MSYTLTWRTTTTNDNYFSFCYQGQRIKYDVDVETGDITVYDFGPRGDVY